MIDEIQQVEKLAKSDAMVSVTLRMPYLAKKALRSCRSMPVWETHGAY